MVKAKILVVGPCESGKTCICNYLAEATESSGGEYHPTQGVRILELEVEGEEETGRTLLVEVELWDCSGSKQFERCWPAMVKDTHGVVLVHNPDQPQQEKELERWYSYFVKQQGLQDDQCLALSHHKPVSAGYTETSPDSQLSSERLSGIRQVHTSLEEEPEAVRDEFNSFLMSVVGSWADRQHREEGSIIDGDNEF
ncbi:Intraflagellar transport protein 22 homolog [Geodia barretti]|uniref:Intraflagellar transport protein 22 homolog n=1 Tax=Geodia barretti TaxID=519541 RepID=A0AA35QXF3_GEOBA|nr:Intraflagellar transport protein 22 homolog [Geodia barretti]